MSRVVFMGTPDAAVPTLEALDRAHEVALVITQPDRPTGRSSRLRPPPVKEHARELGLVVAQPVSTDQLREAISGLGRVDLGVVVAYGRILPSDVLAAPEAGILNVHFSLLPRWRGAAPVNRALMEGDGMTGVTIIKLDEGLDTGPVLTAQALDIRPQEDAGELTVRLARVGADLLMRTIDAYLSGELQPITQSDDGATYASKLTKEDRELTVSIGPREFVNKVRGLAPSPGGRISVDGEPHKILSARDVDLQVEPGTWESAGGRLFFGVEGGAVEITAIQPPGKNTMGGDEWARGRHRDRGTVGS